MTDRTYLAVYREFANFDVHASSRVYVQYGACTSVERNKRTLANGYVYFDEYIRNGDATDRLHRSVRTERRQRRPRGERQREKKKGGMKPDGDEFEFDSCLVNFSPRVTALFGP